MGERDQKHTRNSSAASGSLREHHTQQRSSLYASCMLRALSPWDSAARRVLPLSCLTQEKMKHREGMYVVEGHTAYKEQKQDQKLG